MSFRNEKFENEWKLLYAIIVAGKTAKFATSAMKKFYPCTRYFVPDLYKAYDSPFAMIRRLDRQSKTEGDGADYLMHHIRCSHLGNYNKTVRAFRECSKSRLDLKTCTVAQLEAIHGIGPKSARFFVLWGVREKSERVAALDVHVLRFLRHLGHPAPKSTPTGKRYVKLEAAFLGICDELGLEPKRVDWAVWSLYSGNIENDPQLLSDIEIVGKKLFDYKGQKNRPL